MVRDGEERDHKAHRKAFSAILSYTELRSWLKIQDVAWRRSAVWVGGGGVLFAALGSSVVLECGTRSLQDEMERQGWCTSLGFTDVSLLFGLSILACTSL